MVNAYLEILNQPNEKVKNEVFNVGFENYTLDEIGGLVKKMGEDIIIEYKETNDHRSYHISSNKILKSWDINLTFQLKKVLRILKWHLNKNY